MASVPNSSRVSIRHRDNGRRLGVARVHGRSMEPTLRDGDVLLVLHGAAPRRGRLSVLRIPTAPGSSARVVAVKRVTGRDPADPTRLWVERDNPLEGVDSWAVGGIPAGDHLARVLLRLPRRLTTLAKLRRGTSHAG